MKKIILIATSILLVFIVGFSIIASIFLKPIAKDLIQTQLAEQGYQNATIGDISVGLHKTTITDIALNNPGQTKIGELSVSYWPLQLVNKRIDTVTISNSTIDVFIKKNGDVLVADYLVYNLLTAQTKIQKTGNNYNQSNFSLIKKAHAATPTPSLPLEAIAADDLNLTIKTPSGKQIKTTIDANYSISSNSVEGNVVTKDTDMTSLMELISLVKPTAVTGVNITSGAFSSDIAFSLKDISKPTNIDGSGTVTVKDLSLTKDGIGVQKLNTQIDIANILPFSTKSDQKVTIEAITKSIVTARNIAAVFGLKDTTKLDLNSLFLNLSGGTISTSPFKTDLKNINGVVDVSLKEINLLDFSKLLGLGVLIKGEVNADIPVKIVDNKVVIDRSTINLLIASITGANIEKTATDLIDGVIKGGDDGAKAARDVLNGFIGGFGGSKK